MSQKLSGESFLAVVGKSGLVEPERLTRIVDSFVAADGDRADPIKLADMLVEKGTITRWQAEKLLLGKHKGYFLGKYRLLALLGKGGMSSVYLAEHVLMRRRCAIKVLPAKRVGDSSYLARFHREAQAVASLDNPNIVRAYDVDHQTDRDAEIHFLVMEYVEGESLQEVVARRGVVGFTDAVDYVRQAALGLAHAHKAGLVHRDIKPGNLLLDKHGTVKILDLGLARFFNGSDEEQALTIQHDEKVLGTADYLAPEQALDSHTVDARADIYSLGCTLYFLLTGQPPFTEGTLAQRLMAHQTKEPPAVESKRPDTPTSLIEVLKKMMAKKADDRYGSAQETATTLLQWLDRNAEPAWRKAHSGIFSELGDASRRAAPVAARVISPVAKAGVAAPVAAKAAPKVAAAVARGGDVPTPQPAVNAPSTMGPAPPLGTAETAVSAEPELAAFFAGMGTASSPGAPAAKPGSSISVPSPSSKSQQTATESSKKSPVKPASSKSKLTVDEPVRPAPPPVAAAAEPSVAPAAVDVSPPKQTQSSVVAAEGAVANPEPPPAPVSGGPDFSFLNQPAETAAETTVPAFNWSPVSEPDEPGTSEFDFATEANLPNFEEPVAVEEVEPVVESPPPAEEVPVLTEPAPPAVNAPGAEAVAPPAVVMNEPSFPGEFPGVAEQTTAMGGFGIDTGVSVSARSAKPAAKTSPTKAAKPGGVKGTRKTVPKSWIMIGGGVAAFLVVTIVAGSTLGWFGSKPTTIPTKTTETTKTDSVADADDGPTEKAATKVKDSGPAPSAAWARKRDATVGPGAEFPTISAALAQIRQNFQARNRSDRFDLTVKPGTYNDRIAMNGKEWKGDIPGNVVIRGEGEVILKPSTGDPAIHLENVTGVQIGNLTVQADGKPIAIELAETLDRCLLQNVRVTGFSDAGVMLSGALGPSFSTDRLILEGVEIRGNSGAVGVRGAKGKQSDSVDCQNILFQRCRFIGPLAAGVSVRGTDTRGWEFRECIFHQATAGVELLDGASWSQFLLVNNTFFECPIGVRIAKQPPTTSKNFLLRRNLFFGCANGEVVIQEGFDGPTLINAQMLGNPMTGNWSDRPAPAEAVPGEVPMWGGGERGRQGIEFVSTDPANPKFLAPTDAAPQRQVGGQLPGEPGWIGAVGP